MRKHSFLAYAVLSLAALTSCGGPNGDPTHDAEAFEDLLEKFMELDLKEQMTDQEHMDYYAENEDLDTWKDYKKEYEKFEKEIMKDKYQDKIDDLNEKIQEAEEEMRENATDEDDEDDE